MESGTYRVTSEMIEYLKTNPLEHASNLGAILADSIARIAGVEAFIVDPVVVDEMSDVAKVTGIPGIKRISIFHALNQKAVAREAAKILQKKYEECNLIVAHLGGGISVGAHKQGRVVDVNNALNGDGPIAPERAGSIPAWSLIELATSGKYDLASLRRLLTGGGGAVAFLKTNDMRRVDEMARQGNRQAALVYQAIAYTVAKEIGSLAPVLEGALDAIVITGGIAFDQDFVEQIRRKVAFLAPVLVLPGEDEMSALAKGASRVLRGEEKEKTWKYQGGPS
jgi:butyrate kinase